MRQFKKVNLDGKGSDIIRLEGKGDSIFEHKVMPSESGIKPVPAHPEESPTITRPESLFASEKPDPYRYVNKYDKMPTKYTRPGEAEPSEYTHKVSEGPSKYTRPDESEPSKFTWKYSKHSFKSDVELGPPEVQERAWPTKLKWRR